MGAEIAVPSRYTSIYICQNNLGRQYFFVYSFRCCSSPNKISCIKHKIEWFLYFRKTVKKYHLGQAVENCKRKAYCQNQFLQ